MKIWNTPAVEELEIKLTASEGGPGSTEQAGYQDPSTESGFVWATYDSNEYYETAAGCVELKEHKGSTES